MSDYEKAFDTVQHHKVITQLRKLDLDIRCIKKQYWHQNAKVRMEMKYKSASHSKISDTGICVLSPLLFNLY